MKIAAGGFQHETNTFAAVKADLEDFEQADGWPALTRGAGLGTAVAGMNLPIAGFLEEARSAGHRIVPLTWCAATPSAQVTERAFERVCALLLEDLRAAGSVDAVYLDLHGAMVAEHVDDADAEILRRVRGVIGSETPLLASLDFHANVSPAMLAHASALVAYRTYPHIDMAATGARAARLLEPLAAGRLRAKALRQASYLIPLTWQCTDIEPMASIVEAAAQAEREGVASVSVMAGFPLADVADCGPAVIAFGADPAAVNAAADRLVAQLQAQEHGFAGRLWSPREAVAAALRRSADTRGPVILADTQDNPGAGGYADTVGLLRELIAQRAQGAVLGLLYDPEAAARAHEAGEGATLPLHLGAKSGFPGEEPLAGAFRVERLGDERFTATGPFYRGCRMQLGPMAHLRTGGVSVVVASRRQQAADQAMFRHLGIEPAAQRILALKSSVHFRADFGPIASGILVVAAPGPSIADPGRLPFRKLRPGVRTRPLGTPLHP